MPALLVPDPAPAASFEVCEHLTRFQEVDGLGRVVDACHDCGAHVAVMVQPGQWRSIETVLDPQGFPIGFDSSGEDEALSWWPPLPGERDEYGEMTESIDDTEPAA